MLANSNPLKIKQYLTNIFDTYDFFYFIVCI